MNTKKFQFFCFFFLTSFISFSQVNEIDLLKSELDTVCKKKLNINSVSVDKKGNWFILFADFGYSFVRTDKELQKNIEELNSKQKNLKTVRTFNDSWIIVFGKNGFRSDSLNEKSKQILSNLNKNGNTIKDIEFITHENFAILYDKNSFKYTGNDYELKQKLSDLQNKDATLKDITFFNENSWIILYGKNGFAFKNIP